MGSKVNKILVIGGSDPTTGAGIQVDILCLLELGTFPSSVITSVTSQNSQGVQNIWNVSPEMLKNQLESVLVDFEVDAVKIGMLGSKKNLQAICEFFESRSFANIVLDPVLESSSGYELLEKEAIPVLKSRLLPLVTVVTPNVSEAAELVSFPVTDVSEMKKAAKAVGVFGPDWVVVKGGHLKENQCVDILYGKVHGRGVYLEYPGKRLPVGDVRGTGCIFSSSLAANLACGLTVREAVREAKLYTQRKVESASKLGKGRPQIVPTFIDRGEVD